MSIDQNDVLNYAFKTKYKPKTILNTVIKRTGIWDLFRMTFTKIEGSDTEGQYFEYSMQLGNVQSVGMRDEQGNLPTPGNPSGIKGRARLKKQLITFQTSWNALRNAVGGEDSFGTFTETVITPAVYSAVDDLDRQCCGYGVGILCRIDGTPALTMPVDAPYGIADNTGGSLVPNIQRGMRIVYGPNADGTGLRSGGLSSLIDTVDHDGNAGGGNLAVQSFPADCADNDFIWRGDDGDNNAPLNGVEKEIMGLLGFVDDGTLLETIQNISRTTNAELKSRVINAAAAPYSGSAPDILFQRMADDAKTYGNGTTTHLVTTPAVWRVAFNKMVTAYGGFGASQSQAGGLVGSAKGISYMLNGRQVELRKEDHLPKGKAFALDSSTLHRMGDEAGEWDNRTGSMWRPVMVGAYGKDSYYALHRMYTQNFCDDPRKNVRADGIDETAA